MGPTSSDETIIENMVLSGVDVFRLNFSHGNHEEHAELIKKVDRVIKRLNRAVTILQDLQGPRLRVGHLPKEGISLNAGKVVQLRRFSDNQQKDEFNESELTIPLDVPDVIHILNPKSRILLDDGNIELAVQNITDNTITAKVILGGILHANKGVNLPGISLNIPAFTEKDQSDLEFGLSHGVDAIAISFVRNANDIDIIRKSIQSKFPDKADTPIIAKLELPEAIQNLEEILDAADGVMVARGDLGVETSISAVPIIQKEIIQASNKKAKLVITATQMLDSMIENPHPTRAESSDVANAIFDGTDAVMLSGETANGKYPLESVSMMNSIVLEAEAHASEWGRTFYPDTHGDMNDPMALAFAARELAHDRDVAGIAVFTQTGRSAVYLSKVRPQVPIFAFTPVKRTYQRLSMYWGVIPNLVTFSTSLEEMIKHVEEGLLNLTSIQLGQKVVLISGFPIDAMLPANLALLYTIGK